MAAETGKGRAALWIGVYLALVLLPLVVLLVGERPRPGGFWWDFSLALGYATLGMMGVQFALTARFKRATAPFGIDIIYYFHRHLAGGAFLLLLLHAGILAVRHPDALGSLDPRVMSGHLRWGWIGLLAFALLMTSSLGRKQLGIEYDAWRRIHAVLAVLGVVAGLLHALGSGSYLASTADRAVWIGLAAFWLGLVAYVRLWRPWQLSRHAWRVDEVRPECAGTWTLTLTPENGQSFAYQPGQFAWLTLRASPFAMREHPFSFASTPTRPGRVAFTIKELGDFTSRIGEVKPGERAWVDGPYGSFSIDRHPDARGYVFVAGGVGIAPVMSMLRALADRGDTRPTWLFYGNRVAHRIVFRDELDAIAARTGLRVVHALLEPPPDWTGETGYVTREVLARHLPRDLSGLHCFVCGPTPMIRLVERALDGLGVPLSRVHSEIFDLA